MKFNKSFVFGMLVVPCALAGLTGVFASDVTLPHVFSPNTPARADEVNENFAAVQAAVDDNHSLIQGLRNGPQAINQSVMTTARFPDLDPGTYTISIFVRGTANEVLLNRGDFAQQILVQEGSGTPSHLRYFGEDVDTTLDAGNAELLRTIGTYTKSSGAAAPLLVTWKAHAHVSGLEGSFADFQVRVDGREGQLGSRVVMFVGR